MNDFYEIPAEQPAQLTWSSLLANTYKFYFDHFWKLCRIGLPVALLTSVFAQVQRSLSQQLFARLMTLEWWFPSQWYSPILWLVQTVTMFITGGVYWLLSAIFFAGVASKVINPAEETPLSDAYSKVRTRMRPLLAIGLLTWITFFLGRMMVVLPFAAVMNRFINRENATFIFFLSKLPVLIIAGLLSRFALAVPELMDDPGITVRAAMRNSLRKTENWEPFFMFFIAKAALVAYAVYWLAGFGFERLFERTSISQSAYYWISWTAYVCLFAMLESPLFIAFSILQRDAKVSPEDAFSAPAIR